MIRRIRAAVVAALVVSAGWLARAAVHYGVGVAGGVCLTVGAALVLPAAGWVTAGVLLLALDRKVP